VQSAGRTALLLFLDGRYQNGVGAAGPLARCIVSEQPVKSTINPAIDARNVTFLALNESIS
jgi:hypothetical protein